ncbi:MAG TPA: hypothetical protein VNT75_21475 [Symbiobacteriaceae bacterium]|nr:hypothetical protein [Symbiobacteriaceae bacterium]
MPGHEVVTGLFRKLFGRRGTQSPAEAWLRQRREASPEEVIRQHFAAMAAHDLDWLLATMAPERARLYNDPRTLDKRRLTVTGAMVVSVEPADKPVPLPSFAERYKSTLALKVEYELNLVQPEQRRDPTLRDGRDWSYYVLVSEGTGKPWQVADWGR